ncbi:MAG: hypothetical protein WAV04_02265 [Candidatus Microsaccharimonas sp.]
MIVVTAHFGPAFNDSIATFKQYSSEILSLVLRDGKRRFRANEIAYVSRKAKSRSQTIDVYMQVDVRVRLTMDERLALQDTLNDCLRAMFPELRINVELGIHLEFVGPHRARRWTGNNIPVLEIIEHLREDLALNEAIEGRSERLQALESKSRERVIANLIKLNKPEAIPDFVVTKQ